MRECDLLIVPYGIETNLSYIRHNGGHLLIVPYGIETLALKALSPLPAWLLIVPYGIETAVANKNSAVYDHF